MNVTVLCNIEVGKMPIFHIFPRQIPPIIPFCKYLTKNKKKIRATFFVRLPVVTGLAPIIPNCKAIGTGAYICASCPIKK